MQPSVLRRPYLLASLMHYFAVFRLFLVPKSFCVDPKGDWTSSLEMFKYLTAVCTTEGCSTDRQWAWESWGREKGKKCERDDINVSFSQSLSQLQHICMGFRLVPLSCSKQDLLKSRDAWTLHSSTPKVLKKFSWSGLKEKNQLDLGATSRVGTLWTHCHKFCGEFFSHHWTEDKVLHLLDTQWLRDYVFL